MKQLFALNTHAHLYVPGLWVQVVGDGRAIGAGTGYASLEFGIPICTDTRANFGSVAKQITGHLIVLSAKNGLLRLDDTVQHYLPRFILHDVTILDLLQHRGGVRDAESVLSLAGFRDWDHYTAADLLEISFRQRTRAGIARTFLYSNTGYLLLAAILESVHSRPLNSIAHDLIFSQLGMSSTVFRSRPDQVLPLAASAYKRNAEGDWVHAARPVALAGPGSLWSTVSDMDRWLTYVWKHWPAKTLNRLPFEEEVPYLDADTAQFSYGAGLCTATGMHGETRIYHSGDEHGFSASVCINSEGRRTICWSNRADLRADLVTLRLARLSERDQPSSNADLMEFVDEQVAHLCRMQSQNTRQVAPPDLVTIGTFRCEEIPGSLRLSRSSSSSSIFLWRRGVVDELKPDESHPGLYKGGGMIVSLDSTDLTEPASFTLHLERAPDIYYSRTPDRS